MKTDVSLSVLGAGKWGMNHVKTAAKLGVLSAVYDTDPARLSAASACLSEIGLDHSPVSFKDTDERSRPTSEGQAVVVKLTTCWSDIALSKSTAAVVATPPSTHTDLACKLLRCGKDVLVEKPMSLSVKDATRLRALAKQFGRVLMVGHLLHFTPLHMGLKTVLASGVAGNITRVHAQRKNLGTVRLGEDVIWSIGPHDVSLVLSLAGNKKVSSVSCTGQSIVTKGIVDSATIVVVFDDETHGVIDVSWLHPSKKREVMVYGSKGCVHLQETAPSSEALVFHPWLWKREGEGNTARVLTSVGPVEPVGDLDHSLPPLEREVRHFLTCCQSREEPVTSANEGVEVVRVLCAASESLKAGGAAINLSVAAKPENFIHPLSCVDEGAVVGAGSKIWHYTHVMPGAVIGSNSSLGQNVNVGSKARIGDHVKIQNNVSVYDGVTIENDVFLGPSCVFTNVKTPRAFVSRKSEFVPTLVKRGASVGANATVVCGVTIGEYAMVGAGAVVTRDVAPYSLVVGSPARPTDWVSEHGVKLVPLENNSENLMECPVTGRIYQGKRDENGSITSVSPQSHQT